MGNAVGVRLPHRLAVPLVRRLRAIHFRGRHLLVLDLAGITVAAYAAIALRLESLSAPLGEPLFPMLLALVLTARTSVNIPAGLYNRRWRFASVPDLERVVIAIALGSATAILVCYGLLGPLGVPVEQVPRSFWVIEALLSVAVLGGLRFTIRAAFEHAEAMPESTSHPGAPTLLYGAGRTGVTLARSAMRHPGAGVHPVGFLDDDPDLAGSIMAGLRVYGGLAAMGRAVRDTGARRLLITMSGAPGSSIRRIAEAALECGLEAHTVPSVSDLLDGSVDAYRVRRVRVEDLLRRPMVEVHAPGVERIIRDRTVLITGGGGSIGSELARQVLAIGPRRLVLVDRAESPLYLVLRDLESRLRRVGGSAEVAVHLANVASRAEMERFVAREAPDVIFHAAAYKHVPLMEEHPCDAAHVNIRGTLVMLDAAEQADVERFVFVSTDKAVRPSSVMGATKRIAEMLVADAARRTGRPYVSVRFGNVLGSTGSVVPIFREQLENGEPLTITDPDMTRFFMTIPEAAWLILDAASLGRDGDLFVLDMGEPVRVMDLARDLVRLAGRDPDSQPIELVGLRPGEKLHEELFYDGEAIETTEAPKVLRTHTAPPPPSIRQDVARILACATGCDDDRLREAILGYVREPTAVPLDVPLPSAR